METFGIISTIILVAVVAFIFGTLVIHTNDDKVWYNIKTGEKVFVEGTVKVKNEITGRYEDAVAFYSALSGEYFIRPYDKFVLEYKTQEEFKNESKERK